MNQLTKKGTGNGEEKTISCDILLADEERRKWGYRWIDKIISIFSFWTRRESVALKADETQHVCEVDCAQQNGSSPMSNDYSASTVDGVQCGVGLEGIPKGVLSPIGTHCTHIKINSKLVKMKIPTHCHTFASKKGRSSMRTRAAAGSYYKFTSSIQLGRNCIRNRVKHYRKKVCKQRKQLFNITEDDAMLCARKKYTTEYLKRNVVVFDGGDPGEETIELNNNGARWRCASVQAGGLVICHPPDHDTGLTHQGDEVSEPTFILLPRKCSLRINKDGRALCDSMKNVMVAQNNLKRGKSKQVFSKNKYCCVGAKPRRYAPGVEPGHYKLENGVSKEDWDVLVMAIRRGEHAFCGYAGTDVIWRKREARNVVGWETPKSASEMTPSPATYNGVAFGMNLHLRAHTDQDFTYSVIEAHVPNMDYTLDDEVVCYFCFPARGIAVPMKPGDFLLINPLEYHCVSSRCRSSEDVYSLSCYLKTAVVGGNDNKRKLTELEEECLAEYDDILRVSKMDSKRAKVRK